MARKSKAERDAERRMLTTPAVAADLGVAPKTVLKYLHAGRLKGQQYSKGGPYYFERDEVARFKDQCVVVR